MIAHAIRFFLANFTLSFFLIGLLSACVSLAVSRTAWRPHSAREAFFAWFIFWNIGVSYLYNFVMHVFFGRMAAGFIGWADSPFQAEVGFASLGFAVIGFLAFRRDHSMRVAAVVGPAMFLWGAAGGHVYQMSKFHNFAPGNAGVIFWSDVLLPVIGFAFLWWEWRALRSSPRAAGSTLTN